MAAPPPEYRHEPRLALSGGGDGLDFIARILAAAAGHLTPEGLVVCEVGDARRAAQRRSSVLRRKLIEQAARDCDVVELTQGVLQRAQRAQQRRDRLVREARR